MSDNHYVNQQWFNPEIYNENITKNKYFRR